MRRFVVPIIMAGMLLAAVFGVIQVARGQAPDPPGGLVTVASESDGLNQRELYAPAGAAQPQAPNIGFIDSPTAACYQPDSAVDECFVNWYYMSTTAAPNYIITMTVSLNAIGVVSNYQGFFQTSMYVPYNMVGRGFKVACGPPNAGGNPLLGNSYGYTIRARDSAGLSSANYGTTYCPAYTP
jgi:hypothetical protein